MRSIISRRGFTGLALSAFLATSSLAVAETVTFKTALTGKNEVPPNDSKRTGSLTITYDSVSKKMSWTGNYSGLSGPVTAAHFHGSTPPSPPAPNSAVAVPIAASASPFEGSATLDEAKAADLMAGKWYVNLHTAAHPSGEIRGQVTR
jgi:hypothetical protein